MTKQDRDSEELCSLTAIMHTLPRNLESPAVIRARKRRQVETPTATRDVKRPKLDRPIPILLRIPAEIRNYIYELAVKDEHSISIRKDHTLYCPALSLVCKQVRSEYRGIFLSEAPKHAQMVNVHFTNFHHQGVQEMIDALPEKTKRKIRLRILLDNNWQKDSIDPYGIYDLVLGRYLRWFTTERSSTDGLYRRRKQHDFEIRYDQRTFFVASLYVRVLQLYDDFTYAPWSGLWLVLDLALRQAFGWEGNEQRRTRECRQQEREQNRTQAATKERKSLCSDQVKALLMPV